MGERQLFLQSDLPSSTQGLPRRSDSGRRLGCHQIPQEGALGTLTSCKVMATPSEAFNAAVAGVVCLSVETKALAGMRPAPMPLSS